jgi:hypothetical protein
VIRAGTFRCGEYSRGHGRRNHRETFARNLDKPVPLRVGVVIEVIRIGHSMAIHSPSADEIEKGRESTLRQYASEYSH